MAVHQYAHTLCLQSSPVPPPMPICIYEVHTVTVSQGEGHGWKLQLWRLQVAGAAPGPLWWCTQSLWQPPATMTPTHPPVHSTDGYAELTSHSYSICTCSVSPGLATAELASAPPRYATLPNHGKSHQNTYLVKNDLRIQGNRNDKCVHNHICHLVHGR